MFPVCVRTHMFVKRREIERLSTECGSENYICSSGSFCSSCHRLIGAVSPSWYPRVPYSNTFMSSDNNWATSLWNKWEVHLFLMEVLSSSHFSWKISVFIQNTRKPKLCGNLSCFQKYLSSAMQLLGYQATYPCIQAGIVLNLTLQVIT